MICQVESVKTKTGALSTLDNGLLQARDIQARVRGQLKNRPGKRQSLWSPITPGPFLVPVSRWVE